MKINALHYKFAVIIDTKKKNMSFSLQKYRLFGILLRFNTQKTYI